MRIAVAGGGYVGLSTATGFARQGHDIDLIEIDSQRAGMLTDGILPFQEMSLSGAFLEQMLKGGIKVHHGYESLRGVVDFAFICTSTPLTVDGTLDTRQVFQAASMLIEACDRPLRLIVRSTVNPGTSQTLEEATASFPGVQVLVNPEFLREGSALLDFEAPSRIVIGGSDADAVEALAELYTFAEGVPLLRTNTKTAELIKLASNAALAVRVSMANEIAHVADWADADVDMLLQGVGYDPRIGQDYLQPGIGFGGSCLPKDLAAFRSAAMQTGFSTPVFDGASMTNDTVVGRLASRALEIARHIPRPRVSVVGIGFKSGSDSLRSSQAVRLVRTLLQRGVTVTVFDPLAEDNARLEFADRIGYADSPESAMNEADVVVVLDKNLLKGGSHYLDQCVVIDALGRQISMSNTPGEQVYGTR